ncbi:MAG: hypothetical protein DWB56_03500 [Candidatus Jettenia sp.]|uniref:Uncharacterized protein n=1 Tax=Candidatus Jettenia caeni TaxID=247490 RepID=I3IN46_9BACT|nr:hypothetical protein [Candidatus Jettenia sp. AMX1]MBC6928025.1 hypothetical protein [Candidatus Jettenia sp.]NUN24058.1 hypothetical protein [Candidatus Jettenia caeni]KAA0251125.1 MAG: hypothetical protein EDM77_02165 [Candidatus Jettenia sp. AMX1]MCE7879336.1 hypothetical protein [Candidatus Jettenia sp. AMX1]MCQ3927440.1 hypothetical protein [Candidatus Jettenia sp.]
MKIEKNVTCRRGVPGTEVRHATKGNNSLKMRRRGRVFYQLDVIIFVVFYKSNDIIHKIDYGTLTSNYVKRKIRDFVYE